MIRCQTPLDGSENYQRPNDGSSVAERWFNLQNAHEEERRIRDRFASTLAISASIIAAVRLARDENISRPSPRLTSVIHDSVSLARMILDKIIR